MARLPLDERRAQLVDAAIVVMAREGVHRATTRAIVAEAGASLSVFHYCFDSKQALLEEVVRTIVGRTALLAREAMARVSSPDDLVRDSLLAYWGHVTAHPAEHQLTYEVVQHCLRDPALADVARRQYEMYAATIADHIAAGGVPDSVDVRTLSRYLAVVVDGLTADWLARRDDASALAVLDLVAAHVEQLLVASTTV